jgi:hypothetical protein
MVNLVINKWDKGTEHLGLRRSAYPFAVGACPIEKRNEEHHSPRVLIFNHFRRILLYN